jgi:hypothetical protein
MIRLTGLRFTQWRLRSYQSTGGGEVDVLAASDRFVYGRWQIQCKNTKKVDVDVLAKEIGITFVTGADVEHVNRRLKIFKILSDPYRNRHRRFGLRSNLIAGISNYELAAN